MKVALSHGNLGTIVSYWLYCLVANSVDGVGIVPFQHLHSGVSEMLLSVFGEATFTHYAAGSRVVREVVATKTHEMFLGETIFGECLQRFRA